MHKMPKKKVWLLPALIEGEEQKAALANGVINTHAQPGRCDGSSPGARSPSGSQSSGVKGQMIYRETFGSGDPSLCSHPLQRPN